MFELDEQQQKKADEWMSVVDPLLEDDIMDMMKHGPIGGAFTYMFTPTSIGVMTKIVYLHGTDKEQSLDLTDYDSL